VDPNTRLVEIILAKVGSVVLRAFRVKMRLIFRVEKSSIGLRKCYFNLFGRYSKTSL
jgi:hypothetical protein